MKAYADLADLPEDKRINAIGNKAMQGQKVAFVTDDDPGKAERYIEKLLARFPGLKVAGPYDGPVKSMRTVTVERG